MPSDVATEPPEAGSPTTASQTSPDSLIETMGGPEFQQAGRFPGIELDVVTSEFCHGSVATLSVKSPQKQTPNEDSVAAIPVSRERGLLLVADGLGGHRGGRRASQLLKSLLTKAVPRLLPPPSKTITISGVIPIEVEGSREGPDSRMVLLDQIEKANKRLIRSRTGSATTMALVELRGNRVRTYHVGDSEILVLSQRGKLKYSTVSHSPIGYAFESGFLTEEEAILHPDRHLVSNVVGSDLMSIEIGPWISLSPLDTVLLASDGLFDNLLQSEIVDVIRKGRLEESVRELAEIACERMLTPPMEDFPSKPDDMTILAYRGSRSVRKKKRRKQEQSAS